VIWNSIPLMTAIDLLIIAVTTYAIWRCRLIGPSSKRPSAPKIGLRWIALGLLAVCLFYFADLASMYVLPAVTSMPEAVEFMGTLHRNLSWLVVVFAMIAISRGFIELRRTQIGAISGAVQWRRCDGQGYDALCCQRRLGLFRFQSFRAKGPDRQGTGGVGMCLLSYGRREEGPGLDIVLPLVGQVGSTKSTGACEHIDHIGVSITTMKMMHGGSSCLNQNG
jgi:hypothetical protein